jgi:ribosomal protein S18 acetylase RimI-like enzyme
VKVRPAAEGDLDQMLEVMFAEPGVEQLAFMPTIAGARKFMRAAWLIAGLEEFVVAEDDGEVVGFAWCSEAGISLRDGARAAVSGWGLTGPSRLVIKGWPRQLVEITMPPGLKLMELQAHPARRGTGVGSALLGHIIEMVGDRPLCLTTRSDNPARRLYERHGFAVVSQKNHSIFERKTGARGRILMVRAATTET